MAKIKYIGKKPRKTDNVARTGVAWNGAGDVQEVPDGAVGKLLAHPEVWELVDGKPQSNAKGSQPAATGEAKAGGGSESGTLTNTITEGDTDTDQDGETDRDMDEQDDANNPPLVDLKALDAQGLREYAQRYFGHTFHPRTGEQKMRDTIIGLMNRGG